MYIVYIVAEIYHPLVPNYYLAGYSSLISILSKHQVI